MEEKSGVKKSTTSKTTKENGLIEKKEVVVETKDAETKKADVKNTVESRNRKESQSYGKQCYRIIPPNYEYFLFYYYIREGGLINFPPLKRGGLIEDLR